MVARKWSGCSFSHPPSRVSSRFNLLRIATCAQISRIGPSFVVSFTVALEGACSQLGPRLWRWCDTSNTTPTLQSTRLYASGTAGETPSEASVVQHCAVGRASRDCKLSALGVSIQLAPSVIEFQMLMLALRSLLTGVHLRPRASHPRRSPDAPPNDLRR